MATNNYKFVESSDITEQFDQLKAALLGEINADRCNKSITAASLEANDDVDILSILPDSTNDEVIEFTPTWFCEMLVGSTDASPANFGENQTKPAITEKSVEEVLNRVLPKKRQLSADAVARANKLKYREMCLYRAFMSEIDEEMPNELMHHPDKARSFTQNDFDECTSSDDADDADDTDSSHHTPDNGKANSNSKSMESRFKQKIGRRNSCLTIMFLRERIFEYNMRMDILKRMLKQGRD